jgi:hypothetical protein
MNDDEMNGEGSRICRRVWDLAVEGRDVMGDATLAAHVGSCVTCFRALAELRDAPRLAAALRAAAPAPAVSERFWEELAARTGDAAAAALAGTGKRRAVRIGSFVAVVAAAAAAWVLVAGRAQVPGPATATGVANAPAAAYEGEAGDEAVDVADLDESALRRLLERLRVRPPATVSALAAVGDAQDVADPLDDEELNDALADLDGAALLRLERSLAGAAL